MWLVWVGSVMAALMSWCGSAEAGCGCDKPPPPRAAIRPFVAFAQQPVVLFDDALEDGRVYQVVFEPLVGGTPKRERGRVRLRRDLADGVIRPHLRVSVPELALGPCRVSVWRDGLRLVDVPAEAFTVTAPPLPLGDVPAARRRQSYRAGIGMDGTIYIPVDVRRVTNATRFWAQGFGLPLDFEAANVAMYNDQGFLMQLLDPTVPGLSQVVPAPGDGASAALGYWRHEFRTYKELHRREDAFALDDDESWHATGTRHVNHDLIVVAVRGRLTSGGTLAPGASPPFTLAIVSEPEER